ncbi:MAG: DNA methyltransferase [Christensenellales bacterium]
MPLPCVPVSREVILGAGSEGEFYLGDALSLLDELKQAYRERVQLIYLDPPFLTGQSFEMRVRVGAHDWETMAGSRSVHAFDDLAAPEDYYAMLRRALEAAHAMLAPEGALFLHVDYRAHARLRLIADELFGERNFVNEIIWAYKSGGRAKNSFPKKHDIILFYRKSRDLYFNLDAVLEPRIEPPRNHMKKGVDADGRAYRSIKSAGRIYKYYDDEPVAPTDVWDDISHLQQRDHERTGYDTQKPLKLLRRIVRATTREGDLVMDLFAGSSTTLEAAAADGRRFVGVDKCPMTVNIARRRLADARTTYHLGSSVSCGVCEAHAMPGVGMYHVFLDSFRLPADILGANGFDLVDNWAAGYIENETFTAHAQFSRTRAAPELLRELQVPAYSGTLAIRIGDVAGASHYFKIDTPAQAES